MLQLQQKKKQQFTQPVAAIKQRIVHTDDTINEKVYALYGLSKEEIGVVERRFIKLGENTVK